MGAMGLPGWLALVSLVWGCVASAAEIKIGGMMGWGLGLQYDTVNASVGDVLIFNYDKGQHDVWQVRGKQCNFNKSVMLADVTRAGGYRVRLDKPGRYFFACSVDGHCDSGMLVEVHVSATPRAAGAPLPDSPATPVYMPSGPPQVGDGNCSAPTPVPGRPDTFSVSCLSGGWPLAPGQVINAFYSLPLAYPENTMVAVEWQSAQMVDSNLRPVPLSEMYVHHFFGDARNVMAEGAELRGTMSRNPLPPQYGRVFNTSSLVQPSDRAVNVHIIQTSGVSPLDLLPCVECWCRQKPDWLGELEKKISGNSTVSNNPTAPDDAALDIDGPSNATMRVRNVTQDGRTVVERVSSVAERRKEAAYLGGTACCTSDNCPTSAPAVPTVYHLQYNATYRVLAANSPAVDPISLYILDLAAGDIEYDIVRMPGIDVDVLEVEGAFDQRCPQPNDFALLRCTAHQHIGGLCMELYDVASGDMICQSCPVYGNSSSVDEVGNERGYIVSMTDGDPVEPYPMRPGQQVRLVSKYSATTDHYGVMALFLTFMADWDASCSGAPAPQKLVFGPSHDKSAGTFFGYTTPDEAAKESS